MNADSAINILQDAMWMTVLLGAPPLLTALAVGLIVAIFQAATQINETTLSFIPKLLAMFAVLFFTGHWLLGLLVDFTRRLITDIPSLIG